MTHSPTLSRSRSRRPFAGAIALFGLLTAGAVGFACGEDDDGDDNYELPFKVATACSDYCERRADCDDEVSRNACEDRCTDTMRDCQADEQDQAVDDLDLCAAESCDDVLKCAVGAGSQCYFGL